MSAVTVLGNHNYLIHEAPLHFEVKLWVPFIVNYKKPFLLTILELWHNETASRE
jgi:hypothetical protein